MSAQPSRHAAAGLCRLIHPADCWDLLGLMWVKAAWRPRLAPLLEMRSSKRKNGFWARYYKSSFVTRTEGGQGRCRASLRLTQVHIPQFPCTCPQSVARCQRRVTGREQPECNESECHWSCRLQVQVRQTVWKGCGDTSTLSQSPSPRSLSEAGAACSSAPKRKSVHLQASLRHFACLQNLSCCKQSASVQGGRRYARLIAHVFATPVRHDFSLQTRDLDRFGKQLVANKHPSSRDAIRGWRKRHTLADTVSCNMPETL